jgi:hypothetical protein
MVKRINKNKKTMVKKQGLKKSKTMKGISKKSKHVTRKISNKKKYGKSGKKSKKVLISKLVTRNKLKKMMKGGANIKYDELKAQIETGQPLTIIDLSYVDPSTAQPIQQEEPEQKSEGWFGGITSRLSGLVSRATNTVSGFVKGSGQVTPKMFSALANLLKTQRTDGTMQISSVQSIDLSNNNLSSFETGSFNGFDAVTILNLSNNNFSYDTIKGILSAGGDGGNSPLPNLTTLNLFGNPLTSDDLTNLRNLRQGLTIIFETSQQKSTGAVANTNTGTVANTGANTGVVANTGANTGAVA